MKMILGIKKGMTTIFDETGAPVAVTLINAGPCVVTQIKTPEKDGYFAFQIGFGQAKKLNKPQKGHLKEKLLRYLREMRVKNGEKVELKVGDEINVDIFRKGELVDVVGVSKGKGFAGVIKRHGFQRGPETHGSDHHRAPGSIGCMYPEHVIKGKRMPGRMGGKRVTVKNLKVMDVDKEKNLLILKGAVPGKKGGLVIVKSHK